MAPPRLYASPVQQLVELLRVARSRGTPFDQAWDDALRPGKPVVMSNSRTAPDTALRWSTDKAEREAWRNALTASRLAWERAYEQAPITRQERALVVLADELGLSSHAVSSPRGIGPVLAVA